MCKAKVNNGRIEANSEETHRNGGSR